MDTASVTERDLFAGLPAVFRECVLPVKECGTYDVSTPYILEGHVYATNRYLVVRVPVEGLTILPEWVDPKRKRYNAAKSFASVPAEVRVEPLPSIVDEWVTCPSCEGKKVIECPECDGLGYQECNLGYEHRCEACGGRGSLTCDECDKEGKALDRTPVLVGGVYFARNYLALLCRIGVTEIGIVPDAETGKACPFRAGNLEGLLMSMDSWIIERERRER